MKLKAVVSPTSQSAVSGQANTPSSTRPSPGRAMRSIVRPQASATRVASACAPSLIAAGWARRSSISPASATIVAPAASPNSGAPAARDAKPAFQNRSHPNSVATTIPTPPPRGVGKACDERALGASISGRQRAIAQAMIAAIAARPASRMAWTTKNRVMVARAYAKPARPTTPRHAIPRCQMRARPRSSAASAIATARGCLVRSPGTPIGQRSRAGSRPRCPSLARNRAAFVSEPMTPT